MDINPSNPIATPTYISGRKRYARPQAMLWSNNSGTISEGIRLPSGYEKEDFLVLSDHNRGEIGISQQRIENRQRMINGTMRSYHTADKISISCGWSRLPSRSYSRNVNFDSSGSPTLSGATEYTVDGGAGGVELLDWYENHQGPFWVYLAYDKYSNFGKDSEAYAHLPQYNQLIQMYFTDFNYSVVKRGGNNFDFWNITVTLEEV